MAIACEAMFSQMVEQMRNALALDRFRPHTRPQELPAWL
jgi:hypothetical protein